MRWPVGKYNGQRIVGISFKIAFDVTEWLWVPWVGHHCGAFHWLFWRSWTQWEYEPHWKRGKQTDIEVKL